MHNINTVYTVGTDGRSLSVAPDQESVAHFQQSLRPSTPHCLFVHSSTPHSTSQ